MNEAGVTFQGWVGTDVAHRETPHGNVANFRVGVSPRIRKKDGTWVDGTTSWFSVTCWRALADNVAESVRKGEPVIVHGRLRTDVWERGDGQKSETYVVEATHVGHDLLRGTSSFNRTLSAARTEEDETDLAVKELLHEQSVELPQLDGEGRVLSPPSEPEQPRVA